MEARVKRFYFEEIEGIMETIDAKISELENLDNETEYYKDKKKALIKLYNAFNDLAED